ncbi:MAG: 2-C-methyl-D-erythritol 4-phosphate cytidylyltransferase [Thermodesulfobacteriota bacterium]
MADKVVAVVPAAGGGRRMGADLPKQFLPLGGLPILTRTLMALEAAAVVDQVVLVAPPGLEAETRRRCVEGRGLTKLAAVVAGGAERQDSVSAGLTAAAGLGAGWVLVHDAARPLAEPALFGRVLTAAQTHGAAIAAVPCADTVKEAETETGRVLATLDRSRLWLVQTPQGFRLDLLLEALAEARRRGFIATDEAGLVEALGREVRVVPGDARNFKITTPADLALAGALLGAGATRTGQGLDVHRLAPGRPLILGGVRIAYELGLLGHSDADVLVHAVMDALLAAAGLGDIGRHFPDTDPAFKDADSLALLAQVVALLAGRGWRPAQVGVTVIAQRPRLAPHMPAMAANLAHALGLTLETVNVAATTSEGLGFTGRGEGIAALALATIARTS